MRAEIRAALLRLARWFALPVLVLGAVFAWLTLDPGFRDAGADPKAGIAQDAFERRVRDYLLDNPEVILEAVQRLEARQRAAQDGEVQAVLKSRAADVLRDRSSPVGGDADGDVTLVEFFDYNCPYCRQVAGAVREAREGDPRLRVVYKEFPILGANSVFAAKAALAAERQGRYVVFHEALMRTHGAVDEASVLRIAEEIGLDLPRLNADIADPAIEAAIGRNVELARALRITGTPGFVVGAQIVRGATDVATLRRLIEQARRKP